MRDYSWNWRRFIVGVVYNQTTFTRSGHRELIFFIGPLLVEYHFPTRCW